MKTANESKTKKMLRMNMEQHGSETLSLLDDPDIFVLDTGATTHSTGKGAGLINMKSANGQKTKAGNGEQVSTKAVSDLPFKMKNGMNASMMNMLLIPGAPFNLVSVTKLLMNNYLLMGNKDGLVNTKNGQKIVFDIKIRTPEGILFAERLARTNVEVGGAAPRVKTVTLARVHDEFGHMGWNHT